jgi:hypothetical protein
VNRPARFGLILASAMAVGGGAVSVWSASAPTPATTNPSSAVDSTTETTTPPPQERRREERRQQWSRENDPSMARPLRAEPQWGDVDWFMNQWTPNRWAKFRDMPEGQRKDKLKSIVANRYRAMQELKLNDTDTYQLRVKRLQIEDRIFDLGWRVNHNGEGPTTQPAPAADARLTPEQLRAELRKEVRTLIANRIEERRLHVRQLSDRLKSETARLDDEQANVDRLVEAGMKNIESQKWPGIEGGMVPPMPGGGGGGSIGPQQRPRSGNTEEARDPAATVAPTESSEQQ